MESESGMLRMPQWLQDDFANSYHVVGAANLSHAQLSVCDSTIIR